RLIELVSRSAPRASRGGGSVRNPALDQAARSALLALASDWAFMVTKNSAAGYARDRHARHHRDFDLIATALSAGDEAGRRQAMAIAEQIRSVDGPFGFLDARGLSQDNSLAHNVAATTG
ncbi:MAG: DUF1957 domain-containing protein, partial [Candidatus Nanopelagicales bacterium]|nr:DUF1957 domain-containing protein [Candidatus Nanopelagicales bacterium]